MDNKHAKTAEIRSANPQTTYFVETTTMHGVKQVSGAPGILKYIWLLIFLALTGLLIWHFHKQVDKYFEYETKTSVSIRWKPSAEFPAVTVCNLNSAKRSAIKDDDFWGALLEMENISRTNINIIIQDSYAGNSSQSNSTTVDFYGSENQKKVSLHDGQSCIYEDGDGDIYGSNCGEKPSDYLSILNGLNQESMNDPRKFFDYLLEQSQTEDLSDIISLLSLPPEVIAKSGYTQEEFIVQCTFNRHNCTPDVFTKSYHKNFGNCFTFNSGLTNNLLATSVAGPAYGVKLSLNIRADEYIGLLSSEYGARVSVQPPRVMESLLDDGFNTAPGQQTAVGISKTKIIRLKQPYESRCMDKFPAEYAPTVVPNAIYTWEACLASVLNSLLMEKCGCIDQSSTIVNKTLKQCNLLKPEPLHCYEGVINYVNGSKCEDPCKETIFHRTISTSSWPTVPYKNLQVKSNYPKTKISQIMSGDVLAKNLNDEKWYGNDPYPEKYVESNIVRLHVYLAELQYQKMEESPDYPFSQLCADLGGVISLYLGVSVATLLEVIQYIFLVAFKINPNSSMHQNSK